MTRPRELAPFRPLVLALTAALMLPLTLGLHSLTARGASLIQDTTGGVGILDSAPAARSTVLAADGSVLATFFAKNRLPVPLDRISPAARDAVLAIEDARFYSHGAFDPKAVVRAAVTDLRAGDFRQGASTLTQQYVKQALLQQADDSGAVTTADRKTLSRKLHELGQALSVERALSKDEILDRYLNIVYFGNGAWGIESAARRYFGISAADLTVPQAALLAGLIRSPSGYDPLSHPDAGLARRNVVLNRMVATHRLSATDADRYAVDPLDLAPTAVSVGCEAASEPFFCDYVLAEVRSMAALGPTPEERVRRLLTGGLTVHTTLDPTVQAAANAAVRARVHPDQDYGAAIVMTEPGTGAVKAIALSRDYGSGPGRTMVNWALDADQGGSHGFQAGSVFKTFVLASALNDGIGPNTVIDAPGHVSVDGLHGCDGNKAFPTYQVGNENGVSYGPIDMRRAIAHSVNTYFVQLEQGTGLCEPAGLAERMGLRRADGAPLSRVPSFTLGVDEVSPLRMAEAYATLAAGGLHCASHAITAIDGPDGTPLLVPGKSCEQVMPSDTATTATQLLRGVIDGPDPGRTGAGMTLGAVPAAGKTGTTDNATAVWFVGYTEKLAAAVWAGHPDSTAPLRNILVGDDQLDEATGGELPGPIWADAMAAALGLPADPAQRRADAIQRLGNAAAEPDTATTDTPPVESTDIFGTDKDKPTPDDVSDWGIHYDNGRDDQPAWQRNDYRKKHGHQHKHRADYRYDNCLDPKSPDAYDCD
ncbi:MAG TPA: transglycosylase domain-containing protein [Sporichthyaceae bacterium]